MTRLTYKEASQILGVTITRVWQLKKEGKLASLDKADVEQLHADRLSGKYTIWRKRRATTTAPVAKPRRIAAQPTPWQRTPLVSPPVYRGPVPITPMPQGLDAAAQQLLRAVWDFKRARSGN